MMASQLIAELTSLVEKCGRDMAVAFGPEDHELPWIGSVNFDINEDNGVDFIRLAE